MNPTVPSVTTARGGASRGRRRAVEVPGRAVPRALGAALALCLLAGGAAAPARAEPHAYTLSADQSQVEIRVRRHGFFSLLSDDHVMLAEGIAGRVRVDPEDLAQAALQMSLPVTSLRVDPARLRAELALDDGVDDGDRSAIRKAMLSPEVLDADRYPRVIVTLESTSGTWPDLLLNLRVRVRQSEQVLAVPVQVAVEGGTLTATGETELRLSDFGIEPYHYALGLISVENRITLRFRVVALVDAS